MAVTVTVEAIVDLIRAVSDGEHVITKTEAVSLIEGCASVSASVSRIEATEAAYERALGAFAPTDATINPIPTPFRGERA